MINVKDMKNPDKHKELSVLTLGWLNKHIQHLLKTCELNHINPDECPVIIKDGTERTDYLAHMVSMTLTKPSVISLTFYRSDEIDYFEGEDKQPEGGGEFWKSRGPSDWDCSGFVVSKEAGQRLLQMTQLALGRMKIESWLDWRKFEPNWIQFKFSAKEFDVVKLDKLAKENNGVLTDEILRNCIKVG